MTVKDLLISGKFGDGCLVKSKNGKNSYVMFISKDLDYLQYKRDLLIKKSKFYVSKIRIQKSGYKIGNFSYVFRTGVNSLIHQCNNFSVSKALKYLNKKSLILFYLDDGSFHKSKSFSHIYCNTFSIEECNLLIDKIYNIYPDKKCVIGYDRKKDGRCYPYIRLNVFVTRKLIVDVEKFLLKNKIYSFMYKVGKNPPSTTIESTKLRKKDLKIRKRVE